MCSVLRCDKPTVEVISVLSDPGAPRFEAGLCAEHRDRIQAGEPWRWSDEDAKVLMGTDLDSGGALVLTDWAFEESIGHSELILNCRMPSGAPHEPVRFAMSRQELSDFLASFRYQFPAVIRPPDTDS